MATSESTPQACWEVWLEESIYNARGWVDMGQDIGDHFEMLFKTSTSCVLVDALSVCTNSTIPDAIRYMSGNFDPAKMTWRNLPPIPVRRVVSPLAEECNVLYSYWDDCGAWIDYDHATNGFLDECKTLGKKTTVIYVDNSTRLDVYDICLVGMIQYSRVTGKARPMKMEGISSCDDDTLPLNIEEGPSSNIPSSFCCSLTLVPMKHPVVASDGHTYEKKAIERAIRHKAVSPMTNKPLRHTHLVTNYAIRERMTQWIETMQPSNNSVSTCSAVETGKKRMRVSFSVEPVCK